MCFHDVKHEGCEECEHRPFRTMNCVTPLMALKSANTVPTSTHQPSATHLLKYEWVSRAAQMHSSARHTRLRMASACARGWLW